MIKTIKPIYFKKEYKSSAFLKPRGCNREKLSLQCCLKKTDLLRSTIQEHEQLYLVAVVEYK